MDILTLKSKVKLGCNLCDRCCIYRGDIRLTPINVCRISKFLGITNKEFIDNYTDKLKNSPLELVFKTKGDLRMCILYDEIGKKCSIHKVKPMQCTMFPLIPENLKRDYFVDSGECHNDDFKKITVKEWLNGNNNNYKKNKKTCLKWIEFLELVQPKLIDNKDLDEFYNMIFLDYKIGNLYCQMIKKMNNALKVLEICGKM